MYNFCGRLCVLNANIEGAGQPIRGYEGSRRVELYIFYSFNLGVRWLWEVNVTPRPLYPQQTRVTHCTGGWLGSRAGLDVCEKSVPTVGSEDCGNLPKISVKLFEFIPEISFEVEGIK